MKVLHFPLTRITIGFVLGILACYYCAPTIEIIAALAAIAAFSFFMVCWIAPKTILFNCLTYALAFVIGMSTLTLHTETNQKNHYTHYKSAYQKSNTVVVIIQEKLKKSLYSDRYIAKVIQIGSEKCRGKVLLNIKNGNPNTKYPTGTYLKTEGILSEHASPFNPGQFDYGSYLNNKQLYAQLSVDAAVLKIGSKPKQDLWHTIDQVRLKIITTLNAHQFNKEALPVALALIMGQRQEVAPNLLNDYQFAGAIHLLSVSGLHVGFLLLFLNFTLKPIPNSKKGSLLKLLIITCILWLFALLAGLSPSVVRAVTMFTFISIGWHLRRTVNTYHTLIVSVFIILLFQPYFLFDVGFQLSYLALFSILWLQPVLASIWKPKNKIANYIWSALTVSTAAQLGTLPLSIYYFHQFPGLFFVTNLLVLPLISVIMVLGLVLFTCAALGWVPFFIMKPTEWSILLLNKIVHSVASFESFVLHDIPLTKFLLIALYVVLITSFIFLQKPNYIRMVTTLLAIILLQTAFTINKWQMRNKNELLVLQQNARTLLIKRKGQKAILYSRESKKSNAIPSTIQTYLTANFATLEESKSLDNFLFYKDQKILVLDSLGLYPSQIRPDIIVLTQTPRINFDRMLKDLHPKVVVADGSNYRTIQKQWANSCLKQKIPFHATAEKGYYKVE
jgi:competence protein ComEC